MQYKFCWYNTFVLDGANCLVFKFMKTDVALHAPALLEQDCTFLRKLSCLLIHTWPFEKWCFWHLWVSKWKSVMVSGFSLTQRNVVGLTGPSTVIASSHGGIPWKPHNMFDVQQWAMNILLQNFGVTCVSCRFSRQP